MDGDNSSTTLEHQLLRHEHAAARLRELETRLGIHTRLHEMSTPDNKELTTFQQDWEEIASRLPGINGVSIESRLQFATAREYALRVGEMHMLRVQCSEYRRALRASQRNLVAGRVRLSVKSIEELLEELSALLPDVQEESEIDWSRQIGPGRATRPPTSSSWDDMAAAFSELNRLVTDEGDCPTGSSLWRHLGFGQLCDLNDIIVKDWPEWKVRLQAWLPVDDIGIPNENAAPAPSPVKGRLSWEALEAKDFERLIHDLLVALPEFDNVKYNTHTNAPDSGRDVEAQRVIRDSTGRMDVARTVVQCKNWRGSLKDTDIANLLTRITHIEPPPIRELVIAFTSAATHTGQEYVDRHNLEAKRPHIDLWSPARLESILNQYPDLIARFGLR